MDMTRVVRVVPFVVEQISILQPMQDPMLEQVPTGSTCRSRFSVLWPYGGMTLEEPIPENLYPMENTFARRVLEELLPHEKDPHSIKNCILRERPCPGAAKKKKGE